MPGGGTNGLWAGMVHAGGAPRARHAAFEAAQVWPSRPRSPDAGDDEARLRRLCSLKFTLNLVMGNEFGECADAELAAGAMVEGAQSGNSCAFLLSANNVDYTTSGVWRDGGILIALFFGFQLLAYISLTQKANGNLY
eukprot:CAMPEP_0180005498 /NCGR_PEP_ID=MMETSP0984-20121128/12730_1 /TAXON_ID=483367 /ORGANISM="non described non described, Strain CCMP 2436" /LENGTH=137 /DNA_ID=CAMNT_0021926219 /DNA_START=365 /DNA_END=777 /DNA_ORIENTATION=+